MKLTEETGLLFSLGTEPPSSIILFRFGENDTSKGKFVLDDAGADAIMEQFAEHGADRLPFDMGHAMLRPTGADSHKAFGWFVPAIVEDDKGKALAATEIEWTDAARDMMSKREVRFFSPAILFEAETRRITKLINVALTNLPATKNQTPLVLDALEAETEITKESQNMKALFDSLGVTDEASAVAKVGEIKLAASDVRAVLSAVEADSASDAIKAIEALKASAIEAQAQLSAIEAEAAKAKRDGAIEAASVAGKVVSKELVAVLSDEQLSTYLDSLVPAKALTGGKVDAAELSADKGQTPGATFNVDEYLEVQ